MRSCRGGRVTGYKNGECSRHTSGSSVHLLGTGGNINANGVRVDLSVAHDRLATIALDDDEFDPGDVTYHAVAHFDCLDLDHESPHFTSDPLASYPVSEGCGGCEGTSLGSSPRSSIESPTMNGSPSLLQTSMTRWGA